VRTPKFVEESSAGRFAYDTWTTELPIIPEPPSGHNAGVTPVVHNGRLYAFDETAEPFLLDRDTLGTLGPATNFSEPGWDFKAHTRKDPQRNEWICFANRYHPEGVAAAHHVFDESGNRIHSRAIELPLPGYMHDFFVTDDWIVYYNQPALLTPDKIDELGFAPSLAWVPEAGTQLVIVPRRGDGAPIIIETEARWMWHAANAFQQGGEIVADYVGYDNPDHFLFSGEDADPAFYAWMEGREGDFVHPGKLRRLVIDLTRRNVRHEVLLEGNNEFPVVSRAVNGRRHRHTYFIQAAGDSQWWDTVVDFDSSRGLAKSHRFGAGHFLSEPIYAPDPQRPVPIAMPAGYWCRSTSSGARPAPWRCSKWVPSRTVRSPRSSSKTTTPGRSTATGMARLASVLRPRKHQEVACSIVLAQKRATLARIWSAVFVQTKGFGASLLASTYCSIASWSSAVLLWLLRRKACSVRLANQRSTRFSHDEYVGVKCRRKRGCRLSQRRIAGVLWMEELSTTTCTFRSAGTSASMSFRKRRNSTARLSGKHAPITLPVATFSAAKRLVTPWRV
jgi:hypothetical protein